MRVLIYSDIHANWEALEAMAAATQGRCDTSLCLGDVVGYGASPNQASEWVRTQTPVVIRGNHDRACAALDGIQWFNPMAATAARWTHASLTPEATAWLNALPAGPLPWEALNLVHGSPLDEDEYLLEPAQAAGAFAATTQAQIWFGHTHLQGGFTLADEQVTAWTTVPSPPPTAAVASMVSLRLRQDARYLLNPGSVGQPRDGDWRAAFAILDHAAGVVEFHRVPYDVGAAQARILQAGLPARLAERLARGK